MLPRAESLFQSGDFSCSAFKISKIRNSPDAFNKSELGACCESLATKLLVLRVVVTTLVEVLLYTSLVTAGR